MAGAEELNRLIAGAYGAALDEKLWAPWSELLIDAPGGVGGVFAVIDTQSAATRFFKTIRATERTDDEYRNEMHKFDPEVAHAAGLTGSGVYLDTDHLNMDDRATAEFMRWRHSAEGWTHHMTCHAELGDGRYQADLSVVRATADGHTPKIAQKALRMMLPDISSAMHLAFSHGAKLHEAYWSGLVEIDTEASMLLDHNGKMLRTNTALDRIVAASLGFDIVGGHPKAAQPGDDARLNAVISAATRESEPRSGALSIARGRSKMRLLLTLYPLPRQHRMLAPAEAAALLTIIDPLAISRPRQKMLRQVFGLSQRQAEIASLIMDGHSVESAAHDLGIMVSTTRLHLHRTLQKAKVSRQIDLVRLLSHVRSEEYAGDEAA